MTNQGLALSYLLKAQKRLKALAVLRLLLEHHAKFSPDARERLARAADISKRLRRERELAFCGDIDSSPPRNTPRPTEREPTTKPPG